MNTVNPVSNPKSLYHNKTLRDLLLSLLLTLFYFGNIISTYFRVPNLSFGTYRLSPNDSDYYLINIDRFENLLGKSDPYTNSAIEIQLNLHLGENFYAQFTRLGFNLFETYLLLNMTLFFLLCLLFIKVSHFYFVKYRLVIITLLLSIFYFFPTLFLRPVSPIFHIVPFLYFMFCYLSILLRPKISLQFYVAVLSTGCLVGIGYPYFALWASTYVVLTIGVLIAKRHLERVFRVIGASTGLILSSLLSVSKIVFSGEQLDTLGTTYLRFPTGYRRVFLLTILILLLLLFFRQHFFLEKNQFEDFSLILGPALVSLLILVSPVVTARELEFNSHITFPFLVFSLLGFTRISQQLQVKTRILRISIYFLFMLSLVVVENSQANFKDRLAMNNRGRELILRESSQAIQSLGRFFHQLDSARSYTIAMPDELTPVLFFLPNAKTLWSSASVFFAKKDNAENMERVVLRDLTQGTVTESSIENRNLYGVRLINLCNRERNYTLIMKYLSLKTQSLENCKVPLMELTRLAETKFRVGSDMGAYLSKFDVNVIITKAAAKDKIVMNELPGWKSFKIEGYDVWLLEE